MHHLILRESEPPTTQGRTIVARIATYDHIYTPAPGSSERIRPGAFKAPLARPGGLLRYRHVGEREGDIDDPLNVYGVVRMLREEGNAVIAECELAENDRSDHLLSLVRSGAMSGVSMAATVSQSRLAADGVRDIERISALHGVSITPAPAYEDGAILALRERDATRAAAVDIERAYWDSLRASGVLPRRD